MRVRRAAAASRSGCRGRAFWLPNSLVDIEVKSDERRFIVTLSGASVSDNIRILHRAVAYGATHGSIGPR